MATAKFNAATVREAAGVLADTLRGRMAQDREEYISKPRIRTSGMLWWKKTWIATREECEHLYEHGYWPDSDDEYRWYRVPERIRNSDCFLPSIRRAERIRDLATSNAIGGIITLDDSEVSFLGLPKEVK